MSPYRQSAFVETTPSLWDRFVSNLREGTAQARNWILGLRCRGSHRWEVTRCWWFGNDLYPHALDNLGWDGTCELCGAKERSYDKMKEAISDLMAEHGFPGYDPQKPEPALHLVWEKIPPRERSDFIWSRFRNHTVPKGGRTFQRRTPYGVKRPVESQPFEKFKPTPWKPKKELPPELRLSITEDPSYYWSAPGKFEIAAYVGEKIGHIRVTQEGALWIVDGVGVNRFHRQGIGTALYRAAYIEAEKRGGRLASNNRSTLYARSFWAKQVRQGKAEVLDPGRGSWEETALIVARPEILD